MSDADTELRGNCQDIHISLCHRTKYTSFEGHRSSRISVLFLIYILITAITFAYGHLKRVERCSFTAHNVNERNNIVLVFEIEMLSYFFCLALITFWRFAEFQEFKSLFLA